MTGWEKMLVWNSRPPEYTNPYPVAQIPDGTYLKSFSLTHRKQEDTIFILAGTMNTTINDMMMVSVEE
jgi:hypothetical protein